MSFRDRINRSREKFNEQMNVLFNRGPQLDDDFWDDLEEALVLSDLGAKATFDVVEKLQDQATRKALPDAYAVLDMLADEIAALFAEADPDPFRMNPVCVLFVGINGAGKTTTVGKLANQATIGGRKVLIGSADTFRAAAIEQLDIWGERSGVEVVKRDRGADPASVCYDVIERAEALGSDLILIDTSGRLHTSDELMRELQKVVNVTRKRANIDVKTVLVIDATTGQNGLQQAREFDKALDLDGVIMTKLDGTAKGGIAVAVSHELGLPILRVGVGEGIEDLQPFDAREYAEALFGEMRDEAAEDMEAEGAEEEADVPAEEVSAHEDEPVEEELLDGDEMGRVDVYPEKTTETFEAASDLYDEEFVEQEVNVESVAPTEDMLDEELGHAAYPEKSFEVFEAVADIYDEESHGEELDQQESGESEDEYVEVDLPLENEVQDAAEDDVKPEDEVEEEPTSELESEEATEVEDGSEGESEKESFRDKMRRWFS